MLTSRFWPPRAGRAIPRRVSPGVTPRRRSPRHIRAAIVEALGYAKTPGRVPLPG
jgi:hypothetical protein